MIARSKTLILLIAAAALASASPAFALDGEVLIDQAKALAGGVTPPDTPGYPITINRSGKYKLTGNLAVGDSSVVAFNIAADNVTIDLNGFRITGGRIGINAPAADGLTVMNGTIANFSSDGIRARGFAIIQDMQVTNSGGNIKGMGIKLDNNGRVIRSTITNNDGINIYCVKNCLIAGNVVSASRHETGIGLFTNAGGHLVLGNTITDNNIFAIYTEGEMAYANNTITGNGQFSGSSVIGPGAHQAHPNYCNPACP
jgi:hypothetical protein